MRAATMIVLLIAMSGGCKSTATRSIQLEDISPARASRQQQALEQFTEDRGEAELHAAINHWEQGEIDASQDRLRGILSRQPHQMEATLLLAETHLATNDIEAATEALDGLVQEPSAGVDERQAAAILALRYNQPQLAANLLRHDGDSGTATSEGYLCTRGLAFYRCGDYAAAEADLEQALALDNPSALAYFLMGCTQSRLGKTVQANAAFAQAARLDARFTAARQAAR